MCHGMRPLESFNVYRAPGSTVCPTRYRTQHFFNNFTINEDIAMILGALQTHSFSFLTQRTYSGSNFIAISSLVLELLKKCRVW